MTTRRTSSSISSVTSSLGAASSSLAETAKRARCPACLRAASSCICRWIAPVAHAVDVLILQHPLEVHNAKGSARLLH